MFLSSESKIRRSKHGFTQRDQKLMLIVTRKRKDWCRATLRTSTGNISTLNLIMSQSELDSWQRADKSALGLGCTCIKEKWDGSREQSERTNKKWRRKNAQGNTMETNLGTYTHCNNQCDWSWEAAIVRELYYHDTITTEKKKHEWYNGEKRNKRIMVLVQLEVDWK